LAVSVNGHIIFKHFQVEIFTAHQITICKLFIDLLL